MEGHGGDRDMEEKQAFPHEAHQPPKQPADVRTLVRVSVSVEIDRSIGLGVFR